MLHFYITRHNSLYRKCVMQFFTANEAKAGLDSINWMDQVMAALFFKENPGFVSRALPELVRLMGHEQPIVRDAAILALGKAADESPEICKIILERMDNLNEIIRAEAAHASGYCEKSGIIFGSKLKLLLEKDPSTEVKRRAAQALGRLGYEPAIPTLQAMMHKKNKELKEEAENALMAISTISAN